MSELRQLRQLIMEEEVNQILIIHNNTVRKTIKAHRTKINIGTKELVPWVWLSSLAVVGRALPVLISVLLLHLGRPRESRSGI